MGYLGIAMVALVVVLFTKIWQGCRFVVWKPYALIKSFKKEGIEGPPYSVLFGSLRKMKKLKKVADDMVLDTKSNDITQKVLPHYHKWSSQYGETILLWYGPFPIITIADPELAKQVLSNKFLFPEAQDEIPSRHTHGYLPTPSNIQVWKLDRKVKNTRRQIIEGRMKSQAEKSIKDRYGYDVLGLMVESLETTGNKDSPKLNKAEIIEECKTFFFAGQETTSNLLTWTIFLLCLHQEWQERLRQEVLKECGMWIPAAEMLTRLNLVNMVLLETSRLYSPVIDLIREASQDTKLGNLMIPKGLYVTIPVVVIHRSKEYWAQYANQFNPLRFMNALLAFGTGPRACIGQNFAMLEAKTVLASSNVFLFPLA